MPYWPPPGFGSHFCSEGYGIWKDEHTVKGATTTVPQGTNQQEVDGTFGRSYKEHGQGDRRGGRGHYAGGTGNFESTSNKPFDKSGPPGALRDKSLDAEDRTEPEPPVATKAKKKSTAVP
jgi:hypothetical protein